MKESEILELFTKCGALLTGHFKLSSGLHSEKYLQCALVLQHPDIAARFARSIAANFSSDKVDVVVGPALGGVTIAYEVARALGVRGIFTERQEKTMVLRRGFSIKKGERVLVVEDVVTTGLSTGEVINVIKAAGGVVIGVGSIIDRSGVKARFDVKFAPLVKMKVDTYEEKDCPLCREKVPVYKPGSRG